MLTGPPGHCLLLGGRLGGADGDDPLVTALSELGDEGLASAVGSVVPPASP